MTTEDQIPALGDVVRVIENMYDPAWARQWDAVGLVCGDLRAPVRRVLLAVDPVTAVVDEALAWQADLILTHHPLLLRPVHGVGTDTGKGRILHRLIKAGSALYTAHTNADAAAPGVSDALARVLGLTDLVPLSADPPDPIDKIVTFAPVDVVTKVIDAMSQAGAGELGEYSRVAFQGVGTGTFLPGERARPHLGVPGQIEVVEERRIEMIAPRHRRAAVIAAIEAAHPYEEAAIDVFEVTRWSSPRGIGRVGRLAVPTTLRDFAHLVAEALPSTAQGVRVAGDPTGEISRVAVCGGSGDSLIAAARACGADVFVTADLRHHPVSEAREEAGEATPYLVDVAHWASEWPWLAGVANRLEGAMQEAGTPIEVHVSSRTTDPWSFRVPSPGGVVR